MVCRTHKSEGLFALTGRRDCVARRLMDAEVRYKDRYPLVRPRSSLLTYLELCKPGAEIDFWWLSGKEEEAVLARKLDDHTWWVGDPGEDVMSYTLVGMLRTYVEGKEGGDPDKALCTIEPVDLVKVKKELMAEFEAKAEEEEAEMASSSSAAPSAPRKIVIDLINVNDDAMDDGAEGEEDRRASLGSTIHAT